MKKLSTQKNALRIVVRKKIILSLIIVLLHSVAACSIVQGRQPTNAEKRVVAGLAGNYLQAVVVNAKPTLDELILWAEYLAQPGREGGKEAYYSQVSLVGNFWNLDDNPLLGLTLMDISISGDEATITLHKKKTPEDQQIIIGLVWTGHGWMVRDDNLFGADKLISRLVEQRRNSDAS